MILRLSISFIVVLMILTEGSSLKVHQGGNATLPCSIKDDIEISWIITNGNQTFARIMRLEHVDLKHSKTDPTDIHPSYAGRIRALSSSTNNHSLLLMNITDTDLMLYCCADYTLEQPYCTKLDYEDVEQQATHPVNHELLVISVSIIYVLLLLSSVCVCWRGTALKRGCVLSHQDWIVNSAQGRDDWTLAEVLYTPISSNAS